MKNKSAVAGFKRITVYLLVLTATMFINTGMILADDSGWDESWQLGQEIPLTKAIINEISEGDGAFMVYKGDGKIPPFISGRADGVIGGVLLFIKQDNKWRGYVVSEAAGMAGIRIAPKLGRIVIFSMADLEGPGTEYGVFSVKLPSGKFIFSDLKFPKDINKPLWQNEYLEFYDFNTDNKGGGSLTGSVALNDGKTRWYEYHTKDWGVNWGRPKRTVKPAGMSNGEFSTLPDISKEQVKVLLDDLLDAAQ